MGSFEDILSGGATVILSHPIAQYVIAVSFLATEVLALGVNGKGIFATLINGLFLLFSAPLEITELQLLIIVAIFPILALAVRATLYSR